MRGIIKRRRSRSFQNQNVGKNPSRCGVIEEGATDRQSGHVKNPCQSMQDTSAQPIARVQVTLSP